MTNLNRERSASYEDSQVNLTQSPNEIISEIYSTGCVKDNEGKPTNVLMKSAIPYDEGMALFSWICTKKQKRTLEIGMAYGLSTLFMCQAHLNNGKDGRHIAIDPKQSTLYRSIGLLNIQRANLENRLEFFEAPSYEILPQLLNREERFDLIFIDGMHVFDYTLVDFFYSDLLLNVGGYIVLDDIWMPSVRKVIMYILRNRRYRLEPKMLWNPAPVWQRAWNNVAKKRWDHRFRLNSQQLIQNPLDLLTFFYLTYFSLKGGLKYWGIEKIADDDRQWDFHIAF